MSKEKEPERCPVCDSIDNPTNSGCCPHCGTERSQHEHRKACIPQS